MDKSDHSKFEEIYQENPGSPAFLRVAHKAIDNKEFARAIEILEKAVKQNPNSSAAYLLLGKAYTAEQNFKRALENFRKGSDLLNSETTYQYYLQEVELRKKQNEHTDSSISVINPSDYKELLNSDKVNNAQRTEDTSGKDADDYLISETLAKIYLTQGQASEAVRVYKKLMLKYPLKTLYYEAKIKDILSP